MGEQGRFASAGRALGARMLSMLSVRRAASDMNAVAASTGFSRPLLLALDSIPIRNVIGSNSDGELVRLQKGELARAAGDGR